MKSWRHRATILTSFFLVLLTVILAGCGSGSTNTSSGGVLTVAPSPYGSFTRNFNPYSPNALSGTQGLVYETLLYINQLTGKVSPWLADSYTFSSDGLTLTFNLHPGIKWSDGQAFTADDVVFTLNMLQKNPALDGNGLWQNITNVTGSGSSVTVTLKQVSASILWYLGNQTWIVPQHIFSKFSDPSKEANPDPVGTGPFKVKSFDSSLYVFEKNDASWQAGNLHVSQVKYPAFGSNASADLVLASGQLDWAGVFSTDMQKVFVQPDPQHHFIWSPPKDIVTLYLNLSNPLFKQLAVRKAISAAIDRQAISQQAEQGLEQVASPTGIVLPTNKQYVNPQYSSMAFGSPDAAQAASILEAAGFKKGSDGIYADASGNRLSFKIEVPVGWSDWDAGCDIIASNLKAAGMDVSVNQVDFNSQYLPDVNKGTYDAVMHWTNPGPTPFFLLNALLNSQYTLAAGQNAPTNIEGWQDAKTDQLLAQYANSIDPTVQQQALNGLQQIMVEQMPTISLVEGATWNEYSTTRFTGWPTESNPYAVPAPWSYPDEEQVILHLTSVSK